jgi:hypothetical protein
MDLVGIQWLQDDRPLKTILDLKTLRDSIAHAKPEKLAGEIVHPTGTEAPIFSSALRKMITPKDKLDLVLADVEKFLCNVHELAKAKLRIEDLWFGDHPLRGTSEYTVRSTTANGQE